MPNTVHPTQLGYRPTGYPVSTSEVIIGRNLSVGWESIGLGNQGRPDYVEKITFYLTNVSGYNNTPTKVGTLMFDSDTLLKVFQARPLAPTTGFFFSLREVIVCENSVTKAMLVLASQTYPTGSS